MELIIPNLPEMKEQKIISPEEYTYWKSRENRTFFIDYEFDECYDLVELSKVIVQMNVEEASIPEDELKPIFIYIQSFGGDTYQSSFFADLLISSRIPIVTVAMGSVMSAGFDVFLAGHRRYVFKHSQLLVHEGYCQMAGSAQEIDAAQRNYKRQLEESKVYILDRTDIDEKTFNKNRNKDWYLTIDEVQKYNIATVVTSFTDIK